MIGESGSVLIARIRFAALHPTMCWIAPLMPQATYRSGAIRRPVCPIWSECGPPPRLVPPRERPTPRFMSEASCSSCANPAAEPTPRPPPITTLASVRETPALVFASRPTTRATRSAGSSSGSKRVIVGAGAEVFSGSTATACGATVSSRTGASRAASSRSEPAQRWRVSFHESPGVTSTTLAAIGQPEQAPTWASTSLPRSLPAATIAAGDRRSMTSRIDAAQAAGAKSSSRASLAVCASPTPWLPSRLATASPCDPRTTASSGLPSSFASPRARANASSESRSGSPPACSTNATTAPLMLPRRRSPGHHPDSLEQVDDRRRRLWPTPDDLGRRTLLGRQAQPELRRAGDRAVDARRVLARAETQRPRRRRAEGHSLDLLLLRAQPAGHGRVAGQVEALLDPEDRREGEVERLPAAARRLAPREHLAAVVAEPDLLDPVDHRPPERHGDPHADLVIAGVGNLVAEQEQVELPVRRLLCLDRLGDDPGGRHRVPLRAARFEQDRPVDADRHRVPELLLGLGRSERQHRRGAALLLHDPYCLLDAALLVRADRVAEEARVDRLAVGREHDPAAGLGHALDAHEDVHRRVVRTGSWCCPGRREGSSRPRRRSPGTARRGTRPAAGCPPSPRQAAGTP